MLVGTHEWAREAGNQTDQCERERPTDGQRTEATKDCLGCDGAGRGRESRCLGHHGEGLRRQRRQERGTVIMS